VDDAITRRDLLNRSLGATALMAAFASASRLSGQAAESSPRIRDSFDFDWRFFRGDALGAQQADFADTSWRKLDLPHDWSIEGPFSPKESSGGSGGYAPTGIGWYRKRFRLPPSFQSRRVSIEFDGIYQNSEVWINGQYLGMRPYGYISFAYDLTPHLLSAGDNVIAVKVDNSLQPSSRWYSGSGIYRHTWLTATHPVHIAQCGTFVTTPRIGRAQRGAQRPVLRDSADQSGAGRPVLRDSDLAATIQIKTQVLNENAPAAACTLITSILDPDGHPAGSAQASQHIAGNQGYEFIQQISVDSPQLWSVSRPSLYKVRSTLRLGDAVVDQYETPFGIREALFDADRGFLLNGEPVKLNGVCLHHEAGSVGAAVPARVWERRFELLREMGCNAIRTSHNPPAPEFLDLCDRMGFLVMDEAFDEWKAGKGQLHGNGYSRIYDEWHTRDVTDFIRRDRNHPSVVLWSCGNEIPDQISEHGVEILRELLALFHREDPTRPVTAACDQIAAEPKAAPVAFLEQLDIVGYNYADRWRERRELYYSIDKAAHPNWRMIGTESGGMGGPRGDSSRILSRGLDTEKLWEFVRTHDYVAGDFMWTGIDYLGEAFGGASRGAVAGVIDTCGFPKDGYYFYQSQWTEKPVLHLFPHWNWKGREGQFLTVACYTNCDSVELFLNGKSVGAKGYVFPRYGMQGRYGQYAPRPAGAVSTTSDLHLAWDVPYAPGTLKAIGMKGGKVAAEVEISTTAEPAAVALTVDRDTLRADRRDVAHVMVKVLDAEGRPHPEADSEITFEIQGEGRLIGVDNGNLADMAADFKGRTVKAFHGMCLAIVQSTAKSGQIRVMATSPGLKPASATINTRT
jgi:beta-galactosidase